jgi:hypothetical protein
MNTNITQEEQMSLAAAIAASDGANAAQRGIIKGLTGATRLLESQSLSLSDALKAMSEGATRTGDKVLLKVLGLLTQWLTPWGVLLLLSLGLYQAVQTAKASATGFMTMVKKALSFVSPLSAIKATVGKVFSDKGGTIFNDTELEGDPATGLMGIATLAASGEPLFGLMIKGLEAIIPAKDEYDTSTSVNYRTIQPQLGAGGYDRDVAYDEAPDVVYDADGKDVSNEDLDVGDFVYDEDGNEYKIDAEGDLVPMNNDMAYDGA